MCCARPSQPLLAGADSGGERAAELYWPLAQLDLERSDNDQLIEAVMSNERFGRLAFKEGETLVVRPRRMHLYVDEGAGI